MNNNSITVVAQQDGTFIAKGGIVDCFYLSDASGKPLLDEEGFICYVNVSI